MTRRLDIAAVIAHRNDHGALGSLVAHLRAQDWFSQIVVVDDASRPPAFVPEADLLIYVPHRVGAGVARNLGLAAVRADYVIFIDSDDWIMPQFSDLLRDLAQSAPFDICLFRHADSRLEGFGQLAEPPIERRIWADAGLAVGALRTVNQDARPILAGLAAFPWMRISRTAFLQRALIRFAPSLLHNDIPFHWLGLMRADIALSSDRLCVLHKIAPHRLTGRHGAMRAELFSAFDLVAAEMHSADLPWQHAFAQSCAQLIRWAEQERGAEGAYWAAEKARFLRKHRALFARVVPDDPIVLLP